jgi:hypothetical protein
VDAKKIILDNQRIQTICPMELIPLEQGIRRYFDYVKQQMTEGLI